MSIVTVKIVGTEDKFECESGFILDELMSYLSKHGKHVAFAKFVCGSVVRVEYCDGNKELVGVNVSGKRGRPRK